MDLQVAIPATAGDFDALRGWLVNRGFSKGAQFDSAPYNVWASARNGVHLVLANVTDARGKTSLSFWGTYDDILGLATEDDLVGTLGFDVNEAEPLDATDKEWLIHTISETRGLPIEAAASVPVVTPPALIGVAADDTQDSSTASTEVDTTLTTPPAPAADPGNETSNTGD